MAINLTTEAEKYALYLPSIQMNSAINIVSDDDRTLRDAALPHNLHATDLNFLDKDNKYWHYKYCLATAATFKNEKRGNAVAYKDASTFVLGDSGGFQIGSGTLDDTRKWKRHQTDTDRITSLWRSSEIKRSIMKWLDTSCDYGMTLDMPLWAMKPQFRNSPFHHLNLQQLTELTEENLKFMQSERGKYGSCKLLNVLQGEDDAQEKYWYDAVTKYQFEGWAFAGEVGRRGGIYRAVRMFLQLREDKLLDKGYDWVHMLGLSTMNWCPLLTKIEWIIRKSVNSNFKISTDSSSPYMNAGKLSKYNWLNTYGANIRRDWSTSAVKIPTGYGYANFPNRMPLNTANPPHLPKPLLSPIASMLSVQDLNFKTDEMEKRRLDIFADEVLVNHNVFTYVQSVIKANEAVFGANPTAPQSMMEAVGALDEIFAASDWRTALDERKDILKRAAKK